MAENPYLTQQRAKYETLRASIEGLQKQAADDGKDLTPEARESIVRMGEQAEVLYKEIELLSAQELRTAQLQATNHKLEQALNAGLGASKAGVGGAKTQDRDPGFYLRGSGHSYMGDQFRASVLRDADAAERLSRHTNALRDNLHLRDVLGAGASTFGAGLVPPVWLAEDYAPVLHRRLRLASVMRPVPWAGPFAWSIPVANTAAAGTAVAEGVNTTETDPTYTILPVTPKTYMGFSEVSRQLIEASNPAVDAIIWGDLLGNFYDNVEADVIAAVNAQAGVNTVTVSAVATDITAQRAGLLAAIAAVSDNSGGDADYIAFRSSRWTTYLSMADTTNRPLILAQQYNPQNAIGIGSHAAGFRSPLQGSLESVGAITSPTVAASTAFVVNAQEHLFSMSPPMQFSFEQPAGPALIRIGIWGYAGFTFGRRPKAVTKISYSGS